jgi:hypothetical protein
MKLVKCKACGHDVSSKAEACPNCGHPIAAARKAKAQTTGGLGCGVIMLAVIGFIAYAINEGSKIEDQEAAHPTCVSDYTKCSDNKDVIEHHNSKDHILMAVMCEEAAKVSARYGTPELPFLPFGTYHNGRSYIDSGTAILIEKNAQFKNGFGAAEHVTATCFYDLKKDEARITISPN